MGSPKSGSSIPPGINMSPSRHSLRLLSNGYYLCDEDSLCWDDLGNVSFSPTQCTVSYKENMVRIFRKRRRPLVQRRLDLPNHGYPDDMQSSYYDDLNDIEPLVVEQIYSSGNDDLCHSENSPKTSHQPSDSTKMLQPESPSPVSPGSPPRERHNESPAPTSALGHYSYMEEEDRLGRHSCGGYLFVNNDENTCGFSHDFGSCGPTERHVVKKPPTNSIAATLTPAIGGDCKDEDDSREGRLMVLLLPLTLLLLYLMFWWRDRSPDNIGFRTRTHPGM
ncbi:transmembrane protein 71 isoform 2-T5 [Anomaloglossus baeobatrachus]